MDEPRTLYRKIWDAHVVETMADGRCLLAVDRHLLHDGVAMYAFEALAAKGLAVRRPDLTLAVADHVVPTGPRDRPLAYEDDDARRMIRDIAAGCAAAGITAHLVGDPRQGIVHVVGPEQGFILPGTLAVCGDSHTSTYGAFGAYAFGIGITEVGHVLATQTIKQQRSRAMRVTFQGPRARGTTAKDMALFLMRSIGVAGGTGHVIEYQGSAVEAMSMEERMTLCNMTIEVGARAGLVAPDETTLSYLRGRPMAPAGADWDAAVAAWRGLRSDPDAAFDRDVTLDVTDLAPHVTWGTNPGQAAPVTAEVPDPAAAASEAEAAAIARALDYMGLRAGQPLRDVAIDHVFIGSCTNGRIEDLRSAVEVIRNRRVAPGVTAWVVPGSGAVKAQAEREGLDEFFRAAGFDWREPGCSMCLAMNGERLRPGQRSASTSNRNFEGRQGAGARTHLMSPAMAAAAAVTGRLTDVRDLL
ncbi:3-isopropylmalate dehydratase large subunit [Allostella sp. ATCC 35155]|nr:3-isopropylmalate dehydratase large subunit [Stella sp. ATCC 35155]